MVVCSAEMWCLQIGELEEIFTCPLFLLLLLLSPLPPPPPLCCCVSCCFKIPGALSSSVLLNTVLFALNSQFKKFGTTDQLIALPFGFYFFFSIKLQKSEQNKRGNLVQFVWKTCYSDLFCWINKKGTFFALGNQWPFFVITLDCFFLDGT